MTGARSDEALAFRQEAASVARTLRLGVVVSSPRCDHPTSSLDASQIVYVQGVNPSLR